MLSKLQLAGVSSTKAARQRIVKPNHLPLYLPTKSEHQQIMDRQPKDRAPKTSTPTYIKSTYYKKKSETK
jgi:hypothetical protein